jgi:hypothetical protein
MLSDNNTKYVLEIFDPTGRKVSERILIKMASKVTLDISKFNTRIYFLKFTSDGARATAIFIKN